MASKTGRRENALHLELTSTFDNLERAVEEAERFMAGLTQDEDLTYHVVLLTSEAVTNATLATSENWKDKNGEKQERTEWHNLVFYRRLAEIAGEYLRKGSQVYIEGKLRTRKWKDREGNERLTTEIFATDMIMLGGRGEGGRAERMVGINSS